MKNYLFRNHPKNLKLFIFLISLFALNGNYINAEYLFDELQIDSSTKTEDDKSAIPTNPFELVEMIRRHNSMNDATNPSDAIDNALESFNNLEKNN